MHTPTFRERTTALVSAVAAIAILGAAVTAQPSRTSTSDRLASLESDLRFQLDLAWRQDRSALEARVAELERTLAGWRASPRSAGDERLLAAWLRDAIVSSFPGESGELPAAPAFGAAVQPEDVVAAVEMENKQPAKQTPRVVGKPAIADALSAPREELKAAPIPGVREGETPAEPLLGANSSAGAAPSRAVRPVANVDRRPPVESKPATPRTVEINVAELNAQIAGYHHGLDEIEAALVAAPGGVDDAQLTGLVGDLEQLAAQYRFVRLYYEALTPQERRAALKPRLMSATVERVKQQFRGLERGGDDDFLESLEAAAVESELGPRLENILKTVGDRPEASGKFAVP